jgi:hypothetical protein
MLLDSIEGRQAFAGRSCGGIMKRGTLNFVVDLVGFIDLVCLILTGFIMKYILPPGTGGRGRMLHGGGGREDIKELWSMTRHEWGYIHFWMALLFVALIALHIVLHWGWIKNYFKLIFGFGRKKPMSKANFS